jgi:hypothetical protein
METKEERGAKEKDKAQQNIYQRQESKDVFNLRIHWLGYNGPNIISEDNNKCNGHKRT